MITHPEKVLFPDDGITKGELAAYYEAIAPLMVPHIRGASDHHGALPGRHRRRRASSRRTCRRAFRTGWSASRCRRRTARCIIPSSRDTRSLLWLANQNCITPHVWTSRAPNLYHPDICVFDLDPSATTSRRSCGRRRWRCAICCDELGLPSWVKTSGSKGFHIVVPLDGEDRLRRGRRASRTRRHAAGEARSAAPDAGVQQGRSRRADPRRHRPQRLQRDVRRRLRGAARNRVRRSRRRARGTRSSAGRSAPQSFTLRTMADRVAKVGDVWADMRKRRRSLRGPIQKLQRLAKKSP